MAKPANDVTEADLLSCGTVIQERWKAERKIGKGGFGQIYEAVDLQTDQHVAVKLEDKGMPRKVLRIEVATLKQLRTAHITKHVCELLDFGATDQFNYMVMTLLGKNVAELRVAQPGGKFSLSIALHIALQTLDAIEALHSIGVIHRDVKPSNLAFGRDSASMRTVHILDFGLARRFIVNNQLRPARKMVSFRGTVRYASVNVHKGFESGRHDDLWSLFYLLIEACVGRLPWSKQKDRKAVFAMKEKSDAATLCASLPLEFALFHHHLSTLDYSTKPDYFYLRSLLSRCLATRRISLETGLCVDQDAHRRVLTDDGYSSARLRDVPDEENAHHPNFGVPILDITLRNEAKPANANASSLHSQLRVPILRPSDLALTEERSGGNATKANCSLDANFNMNGRVDFDNNARPFGVNGDANNADRKVFACSPRAAFREPRFSQQTYASPQKNSNVNASASTSSSANSTLTGDTQCKLKCKAVRIRSVSADARRIGRIGDAEAYEAPYFTYASSLHNLTVAAGQHSTVLVPRPPQREQQSTNVLDTVAGVTFRRRRYRPSASASKHL